MKSQQPIKILQIDVFLLVTQRAKQSTLPERSLKTELKLVSGQIFCGTLFDLVDSMTSSDSIDFIE